MPFIGQTRTVGGKTQIFGEDGWKATPTQGTEVLGPPANLAAPGVVPELDPNDFYVKWDSEIGGFVPVPFGTPGAQFDNSAWAAANEARADVAGGFPGAAGPSGPTAAELEIARSQIQATNLSTFIQGTIAELTAEIDAGRLETEQALGEFNKRLDAFAEAGRQFIDIQPSTIPIGAEFAPGFGPGEIGEQLGIAPRRAQTVQFDPFGEAADIVSQTPVLTDIGVPSGDALAEAVQIAEGFLGG